MSTVAIDQSQYAAQPIQSIGNCGAPKAVPIIVDFSASTDYSLTLDQLFSIAKIGGIQAVYIDNSAGGASAQLTFQGTGQLISCPKNSQGYFPVLCQVPDTIRFHSTNTVKTTFILLTFTIEPAVWSA